MSEPVKSAQLAKRKSESAWEGGCGKPANRQKKSISLADFAMCYAMYGAWDQTDGDVIRPAEHRDESHD